MNRQYDLVVIGGGITGAGIARDASQRGLHTLLLEKHDFASGASSKSSKLIHGGLRYLEMLDFGLVKESLDERSILLSTAPYHVKPLPFIFPYYKQGRAPLWMIRLGMRFYDFFSHDDVPKHSDLTKDQLLHDFPELRTDKLEGGCLYYDAQMLDNRIVMENIKSAKKKWRDYSQLYRSDGLYPLWDANRGRPLPQCNG